MTQDTIRRVLDIIDNRITERLTSRELAEECGYSAFHFNRIFSGFTGITLMAYVTRRKLRYAIYDIGCGEKILDVAVKYGFETHAGFTRAFKKCFGCSPSIYRIHAIVSRPAVMDIEELKKTLTGGKIMQPEIVRMKPITVVGFTSRHQAPDVRYTHDIPVYWDTVKMNFWDPLTQLHDTFNKSRHVEICICFDIDLQTGEFTYLLGVGVDNPDDLAKVEPDMFQMNTTGGLYAKFTTPLVEESKQVRSIKDTWKYIFDTWLPGSGYEFDEKRNDFEYYDERDHSSVNKGMSQMDIYIPLQKK